MKTVKDANTLLGNFREYEINNFWTYISDNSDFSKAFDYQEKFSAHVDKQYYSTCIKGILYHGKKNEPAKILKTYDNGVTIEKVYSNNTFEQILMYKLPL